MGVQRQRWSLVRRVAAVALLFLLLVLAAFVYRSGGERDSLASTPVTVLPAAEPERAELVTPARLDPPPAPLDEPRRSLAPPVAPGSARAPAECALFGRIVDENDRGLAGVNVRFFAYKVWATGVDVPRLPGKYDLRGWELRTELDGTFRLEAPVPTAETVVLSIEPDPFRDSAQERFGGADARMPLHAGVNDLGTFRLAATGAVRGSVRDEAGRPLVGANLRVAEDRVTTLEREADSGADGSYLIAHVKPGTYGVNAQCRGYLSEFKKPFQVEIGRVTEGVDFVLRVAPTLSGVVLDEQGRGLAGARLWGWPSEGAGAGAKSGADGSFTIHLPQDEPYTLEVELDGYDTFGLRDRSTRYAPGTSDLRIVLRRSAKETTRFVVTDRSSGEPIEDFGIEIERDAGSEASQGWWTSYRANPRPGVHPGGELELAARPGLDRYTIVAPGYARESGDVRHESETSPRQVIELKRGGSLTGWVSGEGGPAAGAAVRLEAGRMQSAPAEDGGEPVFEPDGATSLATVTNAQGRFRYDGLDPGTYRLSIRSERGESVEEAPVRIPSEGDKDLGEIVLRAGATILGQVLVPPGRSAVGLVVHLDPRGEDRTQTTDAQGRFRFDGLAAGLHSLAVEEVPGALAGGASKRVRLGIGETREIAIDARDQGTCNVALTIELTGRAAAGLEVCLCPLVDPRKRLRFGTTDENGHVEGWASAAGTAEVEIVVGRTRLRHPSARVELELDRELEASVRFDVGALAIELPDSVRFPDGGSGELKLASEQATPQDGSIRIAFHDGARSEGTSVEGGRVLHCDFVPAGRYEATLVLHAANAELDKISEGSGFRYERRALYRDSFSCTVGDGVETRVRLR